MRKYDARAHRDHNFLKLRAARLRRIMNASKIKIKKEICMDTVYMCNIGIGVRLLICIIILIHTHTHNCSKKTFAPSCRPSTHTRLAHNFQQNCAFNCKKIKYARTF